MKKLARIALALSVAFVMAFMAAAPVASEPLPNDVRITIVHTNDTHGRIVESKTEIGYAKIATAFKSLKMWNPNTVLLDAGDTLHGLPIVNVDKGETVVKLMNQMGYLAMAPGNHDFNYGYARLKELEGKMAFDLLAANIYAGAERAFTPYIIANFDGVNVAFFGLATPETVYKADPKNTEGLTFTDPIVEAKKVVGELAGKYDVLVCIAHVGIDKSSDPTSILVAQAVPAIDVIIDGHSHSELSSIEKENTTKTLIASTGANGSGFGIVDIVVGKDRAVKSKVARTITPANTPELRGDNAITKLIADLSKAQDAVLAKVVGKSAVALEGKREIVRTQQSNLGTLIANGMLYVTGADIALMNGGGIRDSIPAGDITMKQIYTVMPFGNYLQTGKLKGSELKAVLENGVGKLPAADGRYPHLAGWTFTLDATKPAGERVSNILVGGQPVDPNKDYMFATINFEFNGGDDYRMLIGKAQNDYPTDAEVFIKYLEHVGAVTNDNMVYKK